MTETARNGIPVLGLGTFGRTGDEGAAAIRTALELGFRHIDTAQSYGTEENVARAVRESGVPREEVFITTKVATVNLAKATFLPSVEESLRRLRVDRIDLTLVHWPSPNDAVPFESYVFDIAAVQDRGYSRLIGVSNFPVALLQRAEALIGKGRIAADQVEVHPYLQNRTLRRHCDAAGIAVTAYMPLAKGKVAGDPLLRQIAERHDATASQVALAFLMQEGLIVIPASSRRENLAENIGALKVSLTDAEREAIRALERGERIIDPAVAPKWDP